MALSDVADALASIILAGSGDLVVVVPPLVEPEPRSMVLQSQATSM